MLGVIVDESTIANPVGKLYRIHKLGVLSNPESATPTPTARDRGGDN